MASGWERVIGSLLGVAAFLASVVVMLYAYPLVGQFTGVLAMCTTAPMWWTLIYLATGLAITLYGVWIGRSATRVYARRQRVPPTSSTSSETEGVGE